MVVPERCRGLLRAATRSFVVAAFVTAGLGSAPARADKGVAIDLGRIEIDEPLLRGGAYRLPVIGVRNPGTSRTRYRMVVRPLEGHRSPPQAWFEFSPVELALDPGENRPASVRLSIPTDATPDEYRALVGAQIVSAGRGTLVGAAAAARLSFRVEPSSTLEAWWLWAKTFIGKHAPWSYIPPLLVGLTLAAHALRRRFTLVVARRA